MNKKNITPNPQQPVDRVPSGQLPSALAELSEEAIGSLALPARGAEPWVCSFNEGDDE
ncbi:microcyclamide/patellamide family RiPP [Limnospira platensis]|uniref:microcyclamide/patellamide family RiPP n=1 Tax=Limnospira platensis TaxID=118562 RepID=UPI003D6DBFDF